MRRVTDKEGLTVLHPTESKGPVELQRAIQVLRGEEPGTWKCLLFSSVYQASVYLCMTRMERAGLVKRRYSRVADLGGNLIFLRNRPMAEFLLTERGLQMQQRVLRSESND